MGATLHCPISDVDPGGEGGHEAFVRLMGTEDLSRRLPFGGRLRAEWYLVAAFLMGTFLIFLALAPLGG